MDDDAPEDEEQAKKDNPAFMYQSIFGMIAATQTKTNFQPRLQRTGSASEDEADAAGKTMGKQQKARDGSPTTLRGLSASRRELPENKLLRSLPGSRQKSSRHTPNPHPLASSSHPPSRLHTNTLPTENKNRVGPDDASLLSHTPQPPTQVDTESLMSAGARSNIETAGSDPTMSPRKVSVGLPDALKDIFQLEESEDVVAGTFVSLLTGSTTC